MQRLIALFQFMLPAIVLVSGAIAQEDLPPAPDLAGKIVEQSLTHDNRARRYLVFEPDEIADRPAVVFALHGSNGKPEWMRYITGFGFERAATQEGFLVVYPEGYEKHWNDCRKTASYTANQQDIDDPGFFAALIVRLRRDYNADDRSVYVTGISNGGQMALRLAWERPDLIAAAAPVAANEPDGNFDCQKSDLPVALALINGDADPINPYEGGLVRVREDTSRGIVRSTRDTIGYWVKTNGHDGPTQSAILPDRNTEDQSVVERTIWKQDGRPEVRLYRVRGGGHTFPNLTFQMPDVLGPTNRDIDGAAELWAFFKTHRLPPR